MSDKWNPTRPLDDEGLLAAKQSLPELLKPDYWRRLGALAGGLHCDDTATQAKATPVKLAAGRIKDLRDQINYAAVAQVSASELSLSCDVTSLARGVEGLLRAGWPASFIVMFDEAWMLIEEMSELMREATGNASNMDVLAWYVDPNRGQAGFSPHRDRQPDDAAATFRPDGSAMYTTAWVALTDAEPGNSCLYVVPSYADPGYRGGDPEEEFAPDPLQRALSTKEAFQHIRALPCPSGSAALFTHRIIHWGSQGRPGHPTPRISISFGCADDAYEKAYFDRSNLPFPPLELRLALASAQQLVYHERFPATAKQLVLFHDAFKAQASRFDPEYAKKVKAEFVAATKDLEARRNLASSNGIKPSSSGPMEGGGGLKGGKQAAGAREGRDKGKGKEQEQPDGRQRRAAAGKQGKPGKEAEEEEAEEQEQLQQQEQKGRKRRAAAAAVASSSKQVAGKQQGKKQKQQQAEEHKDRAEMGAGKKGKGRCDAASQTAAAAAGKKPQQQQQQQQQQQGSEEDEDEGGDDLLRALEEGRKAAEAAGVVFSDDDDEGALVDLALEEMLNGADGDDDFEDDYVD